TPNNGPQGFCDFEGHSLLHLSPVGGSAKKFQLCLKLSRKSPKVFVITKTFCNLAKSLRYN
ncbi:MAG: hypothetical protein LIP03_05920, partial [Bacteroidales bacterium]|nr:hypothetical protein [Bacteroidales bacterium]